MRLAPFYYYYYLFIYYYFFLQATCICIFTCMQPRYHTPSSFSSRISGEKSDGSASEPRDAADSHLSSFASRMLLHVLSGRAMKTQLDDGLAEWMEGDNSVEFGSCDDDDDDKYDFGDNSNVISLTAVSLTPSMSVSSIARAEQILQKSVPLVNGGRHIALTTEDVRRIRDKELLRFLQANSSMFVKYLQRQREHAPTATDAAVPPSTDDAKKESTVIEQELSTLANRIETFITAFDSDGEEYHICVDSEGNVLVPVAAEEEEDRLSTVAVTDADEGEDEADVVDDGRDGEEEERERENTAEVEEAFVHRTEIAESELEGGAGEGNRVAPTASAEQTESHVEKAETSGAAPRRGRFGRRVRVSLPSPAAAKKFLSLQSSSSLQQQQPEHPEKKKKGLAGAKKRPLPTGRQPSLPVRGIGLSGEQNQRIKEIMCTDFTAELSPYRAVPTERLAALEERLRWFQEVRGPIGAESNNANSSDNDDEYEDERLAAMAAEEVSLSPRPPSPPQPRQRTAREIGDAYMREAREQRIFESRMRSINARLSKLHDSLRMEALLPTAGVERFAGVPPPVWLRDVPPPLSEDDIASMLEVARRENAVAVEKGEAAASHGGDRDVAYLQEKLQHALRRAESIVASFPSLPSSPDVL
ncbi:hypothetical protein, conserved [Trypanosoma cruzi]|uniref:Kinectin n=3 Tax=Trypanosoma cruzi TaxID=5693 RepID=Q4DRS0_TRYCC|nr:hypothetical protein, conserved [Trypanosoma cruzi]EAN95204.1 hypothetical protein, conserved [Trypanosoma cruzi]|eukprot:XP_817055.1 hypothetical protein [Trypanosoma cruzi strain CL Brener]